jgi:hypothetical protein
MKTESDPVPRCSWLPSHPVETAVTLTVKKVSLSKYWCHTGLRPVAARHPLIIAVESIALPAPAACLQRSLAWKGDVLAVGAQERCQASIVAKFTPLASMSSGHDRPTFPRVTRTAA